MTSTPTNRLELLSDDDRLFLTDGGIETVLMFHEGFDLPEFATFPLLESEQGRAALRRYYERYLWLARSHSAGFIFESPTWRASRRWAKRLGYSAQDVCRLNAQAVEMLHCLRAAHLETADTRLLISGCIGPQDDAYEPAQRMSVDAAEDYHTQQIQALGNAGVDLVSAITMTYPEEAIGIANAAARLEIPAVISFTVETDGRLPVGMDLGDAIDQVDSAARHAPAYYMINCAHPDHFDLPAGAAWLLRVGGIRANASRMSHEQLDASDTLDDGDPDEFGRLYGALRDKLPNLRVIGGCCGTDHRHVGAAATHWA